MNLMNLQNIFLDSCQISDVSTEKDLTKKFELKFNTDAFNNLYKTIIVGYISNEKPKQGFRKKKVDASEIEESQIKDYETGMFNKNQTVKQKIENDILSFIVNNKILDKFDGRKIGGVQHDLIKESSDSIVYAISFDTFEGPSEINFDEIIVDKITYDSENMSEDEFQKAESEILKQEHESEITDNSFEISEDLKSKNIILIIDFEGRLIFGKKKIKFKGGSAKDFRMEFGKGKMLPDFENSLIGMKIGEKKKISFKFPEKYSENLANEQVEFDVELKKVFERKSFNNLEEYLAKNGNKTQEEFRNQIAEFIKEEINFKQEIIEKDQLFEKLDEIFSDLSIPSGLVEREFKIAKENYESRKKQKEIHDQNHVHDENCNHENDEKFTEMNDEELMEIVKTKVRLMILISSISEKNNIVPNKVDMMQEVFFQAKRAGMDPYEALQYFQSNPSANDYLQKSALEKKVVNFILSKIKKDEKKLSKSQIDSLYEEILKD
jgi:FKBP-type peptidyl-prolyl cis-trans isomerase (trigger factor)